MIDVQKLQEELTQRRVAVWKDAESRWQAIPVSLTPTVVRADEWTRLESDARLILATFPKILAWLQRANQGELKRRIFAGLSEFESSVLNDPPLEQWGHVTTRMDLYWHHDDIKIIEVNCTIPAMQSYSDGVFNSWRAAGGVAESLSENMRELLDSLIRMYRCDGGSSAFPRIVILHRPGDSQLGELMNLRNEWSSRGFETVLCTPENLSRVGNVWLVDGVPFDIVYRHIFAWRLAETSVAPYLRRNRDAHIYNPISAHYETKAFLALASHMASDPALAAEALLSAPEVEAVNRRVPWSRVLDPSTPGVSMESVGSRLGRLVLKRSVGYGGHQVIMGTEWDEPETQSRLKAMMRTADSVTFQAFARWAVHEDESVWIVQERMSGARRRTAVLTTNGVEEWDAWYDASIFINTRTDPICHGGVSRIAKSPVVNIGTGGGLAPFVIAT